MITPVVILKFEGKTTQNELYKLVLASIKEITRVATDSPDARRALTLELKECLALCENAESRAAIAVGRAIYG